jgi:hypothetical protein
LVAGGVSSSPPDGHAYDAIQGSPGSRQFIAQWYVRRIAQFDTELLFEAILFEGSDDILLQYADVIESGSDNGTSATVGIRNVDGQDTGEVLQWSFNEPVIQNGQAFLLTLRSLQIPEPAASLRLDVGLVGIGSRRHRR